MELIRETQQPQTQLNHQPPLPPLTYTRMVPVIWTQRESSGPTHKRTEGVPWCGALSWLQKPLHLMGIAKLLCMWALTLLLPAPAFGSRGYLIVVVPRQLFAAALVVFSGVSAWTCARQWFFC